MSTNQAEKLNQDTPISDDKVELLPAANEQAEDNPEPHAMVASQSQRHSDDLNDRTSRLEVLGDALGSVVMKLGQKLNLVAERTDELEQRSDVQETRSEALDDRLHRSEGLLEAMEADIQSHSHNLDELHTTTGQLREQAGEADQKIHALRQSADLLAEIDRQQGAQISDLESRLDNLEPAHDALEIAHQRLQEDHEKLDASHQALDAYASAVNEKHERLDEQVGHYGLAGGVIAAIVAVGLVVAYALNTKLEVTTESQLQSQQTAITGTQAQIVQTKAQIQQELEVVDAGVRQEVADVDQKVETLGTKMDTELTSIKDRIYASDEAMIGATVDMDSIHDKAWLETLNPSHYTIQLLGSYSKRGVADFIGRHGKALDLEQFVYFKTTHNGRDWFVLVYGDYSNYDQALQTVEGLPKSILRTSPYIRSMSGTQESAQRL